MARTANRGAGLRLLFVMAMVLGVVLGVSAGGQAEGDGANPTSLPAGFEDGPLEPFPETLTIDMVTGYGPPEAVDKYPTGITPENMPWNEMVLQELNIRINWMWTVPRERFEQRFRLAVASGDVPDIMYIGYRDFMNFVDAGKLQDLRPAFERLANPGMKQLYEALGNEPLEMATFDGKLQALPYVLEPTQAFQHLYIRQDWLDALDLQAPTTFEEFERIALAFAKQDPDGNGEDDTVGLGLYSNIYSPGMSMDARGLFHGFGAYPYAWLERDGELVNGTIQPETQDALDFLRSLYAQGALDREFAVFSVDQIVERIVAGEVGMIYGEWWVPAWPLNQSFAADPSAEWKLCRIPSVDGSPGVTITDENLSTEYNVVSADASPLAADALMKLFNLTWQGAGADLERVDGLHEKYGDSPWLWIPIRLHTQLNIQRHLGARKALETGDRSHVASIPGLSAQLEMADRWTAGEGDAQDWGVWYSRVAEDGGMGTAMEILEEGRYIESRFYGPPTETELEKASTLQDMTIKFFSDYVMGSVPTDAWEEFVADWKNLGGEAWTEEVNQQYSELRQR